MQAAQKIYLNEASQIPQFAAMQAAQKTSILLMSIPREFAAMQAAQKNMDVDDLEDEGFAVSARRQRPASSCPMNRPAMIVGMRVPII